MTKQNPPIIQSIAVVELTAAAQGEGKRPRVRILAYSGGVMSVPGWGPCIIDLNGVKMPDQTPLLADHDNRLSGIVGHGAPSIDDNQLVITGSLLDTEAARHVVALAAGGLQLRASVGVKPIEYRHVQAGEAVNVNGRKHKAGSAMTLVTRAELAEVSIVAVGADSNTAVTIAAKGTSNMDEPNRTVTSTEPAAVPADAITSERDRAAGILRAAHQHPEIAARAIAEGWDGQRTELEVLRASRPHVPNTAPMMHFGSNPNQHRDILACSILLHAGRHSAAEKSFGADICARAADLRITSSVDLCRTALALEHQPIPTDRGEMIRAAFSTSALAGALREATQREAVTAFTEAPAAWRMIARRRSAPDFRKHEGLRPFLKGGALEKLGRDGEIKHAAIDQEKYPFQVFTFAKMFSVDRQTMVDDDIGATLELLRELGMQAARTIADHVAALIKSNPGNFFHNNNKNLLTGAGSALSITALSDAVKKMREQTDADGRAVDVTPRTLLVPPALESLARQLLNSTKVQIDGNSDPVTAPSGNPWMNIAELAVDPRFAANAATWYLFADPANVPAVVVSFLGGRETPTVESDDAAFNQLGRQFRCYIDFGVNEADPRGAVKAAGS